MIKARLILPTLLMTTIYAQAFVLTSDKFELASICHEGGVNVADMSLPNGTELQTQDGKIAYIGDASEHSTLTSIPAGTGIFIKGASGTEFDTGSSRTKIETALKRTGHNLMGACQNKDRADIDLTKYSEIQDSKGLTMYNPTDPIWGTKSDLDGVVDGRAYWVKGTSGVTFSSKDELTLPTETTNPSINNEGESIETTYNEYTVKLFSDGEEIADSRRPHISILVRIDGNDVPLMRIQDTYHGKKIVVVIYNAIGEIIAISDDVVVDGSGHGNIVEMSVDSTGGGTDGGGSSCDGMIDTHASFATAKDNALNELSKPFNGFQVKVTTSATVEATSSSTMAIYGSLDGENTGALLKLNSGYPSGTVFVVKVYKDGKLVGISTEKISGGSAINFGSITTEECSE
ncbi:MAG: hypothetical protein K0U38_00335 [Epsilonproteobacteria bacterium]|nr:hypothetical protein [Campylobacterota bacterium]